MQTTRDRMHGVRALIAILVPLAALGVLGLAEVLDLILDKGRVGETYCVGGHGERRNLDVVRAVCAAVDVPVLRVGPGGGIDLSAEESFNPEAQTFPYGAYIAVVEVELDTGEVKLLRLVAVDDRLEVRTTDQREHREGGPVEGLIAELVRKR